MEPICLSLGLLSVCHCLQGSDCQDAGALRKRWCACHRKLYKNMANNSGKLRKLWANLLPQRGWAGAGGTGFYPTARWGSRSMTMWMNRNNTWHYTSHLNVKLLLFHFCLPSLKQSSLVASPNPESWKEVNAGSWYNTKPPWYSILNHNCKISSLENFRIKARHWLMQADVLESTKDIFKNFFSFHWCGVKSHFGFNTQID